MSHLHFGLFTDQREGDSAEAGRMLNIPNGGFETSGKLPVKSNWD